MAEEDFEFPRLYTEFAKYYDQLEMQYRDYPKEAEWISRLLKEREAKCIIDLSCGTGSHLSLLQNPSEKLGLLGMDASQEMVLLAKKKLINVPLLRADFLHVPIRKDTFDVALCLYWSVAGLNETLVNSLFEQANAVLKRGGLFLLDTENADGIKESLLNAPFIDGYFTDQETQQAVIRANFSTKLQPDLVDWHAYYLLESNGVSELQADRMKLRFYSKTQLESLMEKTGFKVLQVLSGPDLQYTPHSPSLYFIAEKQ
jgi:SAM-dependent methyltransferase